MFIIPLDCFMLSLLLDPVHHHVDQLRDARVQGDDDDEK